MSTSKRGPRPSPGPLRDVGALSDSLSAMLADRDARIERTRSLLRDVITAPYLGQPSIALTITAACVELQHSARRPSGSCICGEVST